MSKLTFHPGRSIKQYHRRRDANQDETGGSHQGWIPEQPGERTRLNPKPRTKPRRDERRRS